MVPNEQGPEAGSGAAKAENAPVGAPGTQPAPAVPEQANATQGGQGEDTPAPAKEGAAPETGKEAGNPPAENGDEATRKTDKLPERQAAPPAKPGLSKEAQIALDKVDFRVKELRAIDRKEGAISRKLINTPGVKEVLESRGWHVGESGDPLNYHVKFAK